MDSIAREIRPKCGLAGLELCPCGSHYTRKIVNDCVPDF
jgi:hypothetical protein